MPAFFYSYKKRHHIVAGRYKRAKRKRGCNLRGCNPSCYPAGTLTGLNQSSYLKQLSWLHSPDRKLTPT